MDDNVNEIDEGAGYVGYQEAFRLVVTHVRSVGIEEIPLDACVCRNLSENLVARISHLSPGRAGGLNKTVNRSKRI